MRSSCFSSYPRLAARALAGRLAARSSASCSARIAAMAVPLWIASHSPGGHQTGRSDRSMPSHQRCSVRGNVFRKTRRLKTIVRPARPIQWGWEPPSAGSPVRVEPFFVTGKHAEGTECLGLWIHGLASKGELTRGTCPKQLPAQSGRSTARDAAWPPSAKLSFDRCCSSNQATM